MSLVKCLALLALTAVAYAGVGFPFTCEISGCGYCATQRMQQVCGAFCRDACERNRRVDGGFTGKTQPTTTTTTTPKPTTTTRRTRSSTVSATVPLRFPTFAPGELDPPPPPQPTARRLPATRAPPRRTTTRPPPRRTTTTRRTTTAAPVRRTSTRRAPITPPQLQCPKPNWQPCVPKKYADERFLACCKRRNLPPGCFQVCRYGLNRETLERIFMWKRHCPPQLIPQYLLCSSDEEDVTDCCREKGVLDSKTHIKNCIHFCNPAGGIPAFHLGQVKCLQQLEPIQQCYHANLKPLNSRQRGRTIL